MYKDYEPNRGLFRLSARWVLFIVGILIFLGVVGWVVRWASVPGQVISPENVRAQWAWAYDTEEAMTAAAVQYCAAVVALDASGTEFAREQRQTQATFLAQNYARIAAEYNGRMRDAFRAGLVAPPDVKQRAIPLEDMVLQVCR